MELKIGETLSKLIKEKHLSLRAISQNTGVPSSTLSEWASNRAPKNPVHLKRVADYLSVSIHLLLFGEEDENQSINLNKLIKEEIFSGTFEITLKKVKT